MDAVLRRNNVRTSGRSNGQPMLFAHGFGCDQHIWRYVTPAFEDHYRIIAFDHVGAGRSDSSAYDRQKYGELAGYATDIIEICDALELENVIFVGHSVAAIMGVLAARRRPDLFASLVLVGPSPRYIDDDEYRGGFTEAEVDDLLVSLESNFLGWSAEMAPIIMGNPDRPELGEDLTQTFCRMDPDIAAHFAQVTFRSDNRADLAGLDIPALVLQCSDDVIAPESVGRYVHEQLSNSKFVLLDAFGHCPSLSAPDQTVAAIRSFL